ncbi:T9SS type A sorting domain-containing protein [Polaribacter vadi]|uniref:T9SS type A sorting domain-containing protein n=1 Tax=Polaribacter vadi TaxID=1774273 RepID=UPI0030EC8F51|tara:strand:- start:1463 stop:2281 length:819 start_codon:yes stop_codon:yes gene_type:complete
MKKNYILTLILALLTCMTYGQIVINEVDADQTDIDTEEFIELLWTPNTSLDGYVVVLFNGSDDQSYAAYDLDGKTTDANGLFVLATTAIASGNDIDMGADNKVQNGADAVAVYQGNEADFPNDTPISTTNLIDVLVYGTNDSDDSGLLDGFGITTQYDEDANGMKDTESIQRKSDGTYEVKAPSRRVLSVKNNTIEGFATYPNPVTNNTFTITTNSTDKKEVKMFNVLGKQVFATSFSDTKSTIDIPAISAGLYILKVTEGTRTATSKLVIK